MAAVRPTRGALLAGPLRAGRRRTRLLASVALALFTSVLLLAGSGSAEAATGYKYWNYFHVTNGRYVFAQTGPDGYTPKDGSVEAYRYGLSSTAAGVKPRTPATRYTVADICGSTRAKAGQKRVGVLIDYGTEADAGSGDTVKQPRAACAVVPSNATGQQVLGKVAQVRIVKQLTCGIDGYPVKSCSVTVKNPPAAARDTPVSFALPRSPTSSGPQREADARDSGGVSWPIVGVVAAIVVLGAGALVMSRRNRA